MVDPRRGTVSVLFTDIVGSTELMQRLGDDRYEQLRRRHMELLRGQVAAHGGDDVKSEGDALMAVFGSAVDAIGCAVAMQQAIHHDHEGREESERLPLRVGIDAGEPIREGGDYHGTSVVVASRLANDADGGQVLVSQLVRRLVGSRGGFAFRDLQPRALQGIEEPVSVCEVAWEPSSGAAAGAAPATAGELALPPSLAARRPPAFIDRDREVGALAEVWAGAQAGRCQLALVTGEAGIGKSSLVAEFAGRLRETGAHVLAARCVQDSPVRVQPFVDLLKPLRAAAERMPPKDRQLLDTLDSAGSDLAKTSAAVVSLLETQARGRPLLLVIDDLHCADADCLSLLKHLLYSLQDAHVMLLATYADDEVGRSQPLAGLLGELRREAPVTDVSLEGLSQDDVGALVSSLAGRDCHAALSRAVREHTEGNPLFVKEMYRYLADTGALQERDGYVTTELRGTVLAVPNAVRDLIGRRLGQLSDDCNSLLNVAAVVGREFGLEALERASDLPVERLLDLVEEAVHSGVIRELTDAVGRYEFTHSLTFDAIYDELTSTRRVRLHGQMLQYADNDGVKLAYEVLGRTGPYVVVVGISNCPAARALDRGLAEHWDRVSRFCRVILYDRRGVGFSAAPDHGYSLFTAVTDLQAVIGAVGAPRVLLWGSADGGPLAIQSAAHHPERVAGLILTGTSPKLINDPDFALGVNQAVLDSFAALTGTDRDRATAAAVSSRPGSRQRHSAVIEIMRRVPEHAWEPLIRGTFGADVRDQLRTVRAPALIVHDPENDYIPVEASRFLHEALSRSELLVTEAYAEPPFGDEVYEKIADFIDQVAGRAVL